MTFVTVGLAIAGACAIAIPILIHLLFRRRRRPIEWAAMRFLIEAFRKHRRRLQLEQLLLLVVRCLIVGLLGAALARPLLEKSGVLGAGGSRAVFIVLDNSLASSVRSDDGATALQQSARAAAELIESLQPGDAVGLVTSARPATGLVVPPSTDHDAVADLIKSLKPSESASDLPAAFALVREAVGRVREDGRRAIVYLLSEFRSGSANLEGPLQQGVLDLGEDVTLLTWPASQAAVSNTQVVSVEPLRSFIVAGEAGEQTQVTVRLARRGGDMGSQVTRVRLAGESATGPTAVEPKTVQWEPGQSRAEVDFLIGFGAGKSEQAAITALIEDDALAADNQRHAVVQLRDKIRIVLVDRRSFAADLTVDQLTPGQWIRRAMAPYENSPMDVVEVDPAALDTTDLRVADAAIVPRPDLLADAGWLALRRFVDAGGLVIVMPPSEINVHQWTDRLASDLGLPWRIALETTQSEAGASLATEQPVSELLKLVAGDLQELVRPVVVYRWLAVQTDQTQAERALVMADGAPVLIFSSPPEKPSAEEKTVEAAPATTSAARGMVAYLAIAPDLKWTSLPSQPLMVPLMQEMVRQGVSLVRASQLAQVGDRPWLGAVRAAASLRGGDGRILPVNPDGRPSRPIDHSGLFAVLDPAGQRLGTLAVNVDPQAGGTETQSQTAVSAWLAKSGPWQLLDPDDPASALRTIGSGPPLAGALLLIMLALIALETMLARFFSHAYRSPTGAEGLSGVAAGAIAGESGAIGASP